MKSIKTFLILLICTTVVSCKNGGNGGSNNNIPKPVVEKREEPLPPTPAPAPTPVRKNQEPKSARAKRLILVVGRSEIEITVVGIITPKYLNGKNAFEYIKIRDKNDTYYATRSDSILGSDKNLLKVFKDERDLNIAALKSRDSATIFEEAFSKVQNTLETTSLTINQSVWLHNSQIEANFLLSKCTGLNGWDQLKADSKNIQTIGIVQVKDLFFFDTLKIQAKNSVVIDVNNGTFLGINFGASLVTKNAKVFKGTCQKCDYFTDASQLRSFLYGYYSQCHRSYKFNFKIPTSSEHKSEIFPTQNLDFENKFIRPNSSRFSASLEGDPFLSYSDVNNLVPQLPLPENLTSEELEYLNINNFKIYTIEGI